MCFSVIFCDFSINRTLFRDTKGGCVRRKFFSRESLRCHEIIVTTSISETKLLFNASFFGSKESNFRENFVRGILSPYRLETDFMHVIFPRLSVSNGWGLFSFGCQLNILVSNYNW